MKEDPTAYDTSKRRIKMRTLHVILSEKRNKKNPHTPLTAIDRYITTWDVSNVPTITDMFPEYTKRNKNA